VRSCLIVDEWDLVLRMAAAAGLAGLLGWDRELRRLPAGLRTHALVGLGAAAFMAASILISQEIDQGLNADQVRVAAGIVAGVGFLGAGAILRTGERVRGLTTAAGIWVTAGIGVLIGAGFWIAGAGVTALAAIIIVALRVQNPDQKAGEQDDSRSPL
jgi:putative Mg2+ transporter-C (MgtC) family protein